MVISGKKRTQPWWSADTRATRVGTKKEGRLIRFNQPEKVEKRGGTEKRGGSAEHAIKKKTEETSTSPSACHQGSKNGTRGGWATTGGDTAE